MQGKSSGVSKNAALIIATISSLSPTFLMSSLNVALPPIAQEFTLDAVSQGWVANSFLLAQAVFLVPLGRLADMYGSRRIFIYGVVLYIVSSLLSAFADSAIMLISLRALHGIGTAMTYSSVISILVSAFPPGERGKALGINVTAVYFGLSLGPFFGGLLTDHLGWRSLFWVNVPLGFIVLAITLWKLKGEWTGVRGKMDITGSLIYGFSIVAVMYGLSLLPALSSVWLILAGIAGILAFIRWEMKVDSPVMDIRIFKGNPVFAFSNLAAFINYAATFAVSLLLSLYLQYIKGFSAQTAGTVLLAMPAMQAICSPLAGRLSDRVEPRLIATIGMALTTLGLALLIFINQVTSTGFILAGLIVLGVGFGLFSSPNTNAVMSSVDKKYYGVASGILGTMRSTGQMFSIGIAMVIFAVYIGRVEITPEHYPAFARSLEIAFIVFACLCLVGTFASLARGRVRN